jgi:membrane protease YdiL (CAAX protease family)
LTASIIPAPTAASVPQYSVSQVFAVWAAAAFPMALLSWVANPWLAHPIDTATGIPGSARLLLLAIGLVWQFVLAMLLIRREVRALSWPVLRERLWLGPPLRPGTDQPDARLWLWLALFIPLFALSVFVVAPVLDGAWVTAFPVLAEPPEFSMQQLVAPGQSQTLAGAWWLYGVFLILALFNTVTGEELLFRGVLLPRMQGACGRWDWLVNGVLFGVYHLHQPWGIPSSIIDGALLFALPSKRFHSAWMGIAVHSTQSIYFALVLLPVFLGWA